MPRLNIFLFGAAALPPDDGGDKDVWVMALKDKRNKDNAKWTQWKRTENFEGGIDHKGVYVGLNLDISAYDRQIFFGSIKIGRINELHKYLDSLKPGDMPTVDYLTEIWKHTHDEGFYEDAYDVDVPKGIEKIGEVVPPKADYGLRLFETGYKPTVQWDSKNGMVESLVDRKLPKDIRQ